MRRPHQGVRSHQGHRALQEKWTAAQQRLYQRDKRRKFTNPDRTQAEEDAERIRMHEQGLIDPTRDPYNRMFGDHEYAYYREQRLQEDCRRLGINCNVHALDYDSADRTYDYDWIHDEHYLGTPYDPYPHDTTHKTVDSGSYPDPYAIYDDPIQLGIVDPNPNDYRDSRYAQQHAREHLLNCRRYGTDCDKFALINEDDSGVRCTGSRCMDSNLFTIVDVPTGNDNNTNNPTDGDNQDAKTKQMRIQHHLRDCRLYGENCDVSDLENDNIGYADEHDSAFPYDHEVYDYYRDEIHD